MNLIKISCAFCGKKFFRPRGRFNEAEKFGWKQYCSRKCQNQFRVTGIRKKCGNPNCQKVIFRKLKEFKKSKSGRIFCSSSCAASVNNSKFPKRKAIIKKCVYCNKEFKGDAKKYCSNKCKNKDQTLTEKEISEQIQEFYKIHERIPFKMEFPHYNAAQERFSSWNKAIKAAGFEPNPVMFSKKHVAKDGHKCDSFAEKIIDDWLYSNNIKHKRNIPYPNSPYTADFSIGKKFVEFFGLTGELTEYDKNVNAKQELAKKHNLRLIKIYPGDLFPTNRLKKIIKIN